MDLRLSIAQTNPVLGDISKNLEEHLRLARAAAADGADLVLFPELSLTGYFLRDQVFDLAMYLDAPELEPLLELSKAVSIVFGMAERHRDGRCFNSMVFLEDGKVLGVHRKVHLVSYGMFDESRDFAPGEEWNTIESRLGRFGLFLCEDLWHLDGQYVRILDRVDALLVASAGPGRGVGPQEGAQGFESLGTWRTLLSAAAMHSLSYVAWANRVGFEDGVAFSGGSALFGPDGRLRTTLDGLEEGELSVSLTSAELHRARQRTPLLRDGRPELVRRALGSAPPQATDGDSAAS